LLHKFLQHSLLTNRTVVIFTKVEDGRRDVEDLKRSKEGVKGVEDNDKEVRDFRMARRIEEGLTNIDEVLRNPEEGVRELHKGASSVTRIEGVCTWASYDGSSGLISGSGGAYRINSGSGP